MTFEELQVEVGAWHKATFSPDYINTRLGLKLVEEANEFRVECAALDDYGFSEDGALREAADCLIVLMAWAERNSADLIGAVKAKLEIVKARDQKKRDSVRGIIEPSSNSPSSQ